MDPVIQITDFLTSSASAMLVLCVGGALGLVAQLLLGLIIKPNYYQHKR